MATKRYLASDREGAHVVWVAGTMSQGVLESWSYFEAAAIPRKDLDNPAALAP